MISFRQFEGKSLRNYPSCLSARRKKICDPELIKGGWKPIQIISVFNLFQFPPPSPSPFLFEMKPFFGLNDSCQFYLGRHQ